ncbi:glycosyltransferase [Bradyrhizobium sp. CW7]|uniref:glycosyltransferase family 4 protein n=1 Tax=Bradyrhizobium sp. CW7 TaxID=2782688 RepID=UPI001FFB1FC5|nr:glycosyltransferase [Bradyrhizobium sp. CW7]MCK1353552.1 glycosyltransferase [Bradyrhizobium sp. CW7]
MYPIGVFHPGTQHSWQTARALQSTGQLGWYLTSIYWQPDRFPYKLANAMPRSMRKRAEYEFSRYHHPDLDPSKVHATNSFEWWRRAASRAGSRGLATILARLSDASMGPPVAKLARRHPVRAVWGYDNVALEGFLAAKKGGALCVLDRTVGHPTVYNRIMDEVYEQYREFFVSDEYKKRSWVIDRVNREHELADLVLVGSDFCKSTLLDPDVQSISNEKLRVLPYCYDNVFFFNGRIRKREAGRPVRFLFTGQAGPRKGIHLVLRVFEKLPLNAATLTIVGSLEIPKEVFARYRDRIDYHPTVPRDQVRSFMERSDYLVFPSYFEGAALVINEAMAMGLGVIQSARTHVPQPNSPLVMKEVSEAELTRCVHTAIDQIHLLEELSVDGIERAREFTFDAYAQRVTQLIESVNGIDR